MIRTVTELNHTLTGLHMRVSRNHMPYLQKDYKHVTKILSGICKVIKAFQQNQSLTRIKTITNSI